MSKAEEKYTWKIVSGEYIPGTESLTAHCNRMGYTGFDVYAERAVGGLHRLNTGLTQEQIYHHGGDYLTLDEAVEHGIMLHEAAMELARIDFSKVAIQFTVRDRQFCGSKVNYMIGAI